MYTRHYKNFVFLKRYSFANRTEGLPFGSAGIKQFLAKCY